MANHIEKKKRFGVDEQCTFLVMAFYTLLFLSQIYNQLVVMKIGYFSFLIAFTAVCIVSKRNIINLLKQFMILMLLIIFMLISSMHNNNMSILQILSYFQYIIITVVLFNIKLSDRITIKFLIGILMYFLFMVITGSNYTAVFYSVSQNNISIWLIVFLVLYYISARQNNKKINILFIVMALTISLWAGGRSGVYSIAVMLIILLVNGYKQLKGKNYLNTTTKRIIFLALVIAILLLFTSLVMNSIVVRDRIMKAFIDKNSQNMFGDIRFSVLHEYIKATISKPLNILMGTPFNEVWLIQYLENNPHNMYINLHANFGIAPFIVIILLCTKTIITYIKKDFVYLGLFVAILLRGYSDIAGFPGIFDPLIFFFIFDALLTKSKSSKNVITNSDRIHFFKIKK